LDAIIRKEQDDGRGKLRYLAEAVPELVWLQLSLEQVPMKGLQKWKHPNDKRRGNIPSRTFSFFVAIRHIGRRGRREMARLSGRKRVRSAWFIAPSAADR
jgi:hypothetical protein